MKDFCRQLALVISDRLFLALALLIAGVYLDKKLEDYKSRRAFEQAVAIKRVEVINQLWPHLYSLEFLCMDAINTLDNVHSRSFSTPDDFKRAMESEYSPRVTNIASKTVQVYKEIDARRFWLGADLHMQFQALAITWDRAVTAKFHRQDEEFDRLMQELVEHRNKIDDHTRNMFK